MLCLSLLLLGLAGCASGDPHFRRDIVDIDGGLLGRYWIVRQSESSFDAPPAPREDCPDGHVVLRYVIDSHGHIYESDVVQAEPEGCYEDAAMVLLRTWTFIPAQKNRRRTPVRVTQRIPFSSE
jgi:TonB family protein